MHRHNQDDSVGHNVRDLQAIVELAQLHTTARYHGILKLLSGNANEAACQNTASGPANNNQRHGLNSDIQGPHRKQSFVQHQDGELGRGDAKGVQDRASEECL